MTTDLGFAFYRPDVTIIDVPGHEKFVRHMLAGATTIDLVLLVVAADDGVMPQTVEHLEIIRLLGIQSGLVAINKCDLVDDDWLAMVKADVAALVQGSCLEAAPVVTVSALTGAGIPELKAALDGLIAQAPAKPDRGVFRLPIDRNFVMKGFGTVVAGTVLSGSVRVGDRLELLPEGNEVRIRGIQVHNQPVPVAGLGARAALNLQGIERADVLRGYVLATPGYYRATQFLNASCYLLKSAGGALKNMTRVRLHLGTAEIMCRVALLDQKELRAGHEALVQLRLESPTVADWGDRYVLRSYSPQRTIGGGQVLEANPAKARRFDAEVLTRLRALSSGSTLHILEQYLLRSGPTLRTAEQISRDVALNAEDTNRLLNELAEQGKLRRLKVEGKQFLIHAGAEQKAREQVVATLDRFHRDFPARLGMRRPELRSKLGAEFSPLLLDQLLEELVAQHVVAFEADRFRLSSHRLQLDERDQQLAQRVEALFDQRAFESPSLRELQLELGGEDPKRLDRVMTALFDLGRIIDVGEGVFLARRHVQAAEQTIQRHFTTHDQLTASEFRQLLGTTRKYAIPLLNYFDTRGLTQRRGEIRILKKGTHP